MHEGKELTVLAPKDSDGDVLLGSFEGVIAIADALSVNGSLTRLDVSHNYLDRGGQGVKILRDAVSGRKGFVLIDEDNH